MSTSSPPAHPAPPKGTRTVRIALLATLAAGAILRTWQALGVESMWRDEVALGLNFDARGLMDLLLLPLDHHQMAPAGFLASVELATTLAGGATASDFAFRVVPWILGLLVLVAAWLALRELVHGWTLVGALAPFALGTGANYYGAAVKPYGADIAACLLLLWASLHVLEEPDDARRASLAGWCLAPALLFSFPAVPLAAVLALVLGLHAWRSGSTTNWLRLSLPWGLFAGASSIFVLRLRGGELHDFMVEYWQDAFPDWTQPLEALLFLPRHAAGCVQHLLFFRGPELTPGWLLLWMKTTVVLLCLLATWGTVTTLRRSPWRVAVLLAPLIVATAMASLRLYPLLERIGLWTTPSILLLAAVGAQDLTGRQILRWPSIAIAVGILTPVAFSTLGLQPLPIETQAVRPVVEELTRRVEPGDIVYVPCGAGQLGLRFYARRTGLDQRAEIVEGVCHAMRDAYIREAESLSGQSRVWLFYSLRPRGHAEWALAHLDRVGETIDRIDDGRHASGFGRTQAFLFDLSNSRREHTQSAH